MRERNYQMNTREKLIDATNWDWTWSDEHKGFVWTEGESELGVVAREIRLKETIAIEVSNTKGGPVIVLVLNYNLDEYLEMAVKYCGLSDVDDDWEKGSADQFWRYAYAADALEMSIDFGATPDGVFAYVGPDNFFLEWKDDRYELFMEGQCYYAATPEKLVTAYQKLKRDLVAWKLVTEKLEQDETIA